MNAVYDFLVMLGICIVTLIVVEVGARATLRILPQAATVPAEDPRPALPVYANSDYDAGQYWQEFKRAKRELYHPYIVWRQQPSAAELINVDDRGIRKTADNPADTDALQVWLFGGSTMWGMGAPDVHTIPSYVARIFNDQHQVAARITNYGEIGYVSTQELTLLLRELQTDRRPDIVVFLDGVNDAPAAALWPEVSGSHMNLYSIKNRFEHVAPDESAVWALVKRSGLYALAETIGARLGNEKEAPRNWSTPADHAAAVALGERAAEIWFSNIRMLNAVSESFGFSAYFFLQPSLLVGDKPLDDSEQILTEQELGNAAKKAGMDVYAEMRRAVRAALAENPVSNVYERTDLFSQTPEPLYIDYVHIAERGNELLAEEIVASILARECGANGLRTSRADLAAACERPE